jgi:L-arabinokinase
MVRIHRCLAIRKIPHFFSIGYGHATRVSAFARHLLNLDSRMTIHIISSAPKHVFSDSISLGVLYRFAEIDPVVVQPVA